MQAFRLMSNTRVRRIELKIFLYFCAFITLNLNLLANQELNIYSARQEVLMKPLIDLFEKETGIKVNITAAKANQLINRIEQEGKYTRADILLTTDVGRLHNAKNKDIFQKIGTSITKDISSAFKDKDNFWVGLSLRARLLVYNKNKVSEKDLEGYISLADKKWKNRILVRSSNNVYNQSLISAMIINYGEEKVQLFLKNFTKNLARKPSGGDRDQIKAVIAGEGDIALVNSYYFLKMRKDNIIKNLDNVVAYFPVDKSMKTHINISGAGIIKYSKNRDNAVKFIDFLLSNDAQKIYSEINFEYPIKKNVKINSFMSKYNKFERDNVELSEVAVLNKKAIILMDIAGWK